VLGTSTVGMMEVKKIQIYFSSGHN